MNTTTSTPQTTLTRQTVYYLEWLDFGPTGKTPRWEQMAFPNYEDETTDRAYAMKCYQDIAKQDPDRIRLMQEDQCVQVIAAQTVTDTPTPGIPQTPAPEVDATMPVWLTARQITLLSYLLCQQQRQLETDNDPEPIAKDLQSDRRPVAQRAGFLTMQILQLLAAVELTHYRLGFIANQATTPEQQQQLVAAWRQVLPTAVIYQVSTPR